MNFNKVPSIILQAVYVEMTRRPPAGLDEDDVAGFFGRRWDALQEAARHAFDVAFFEFAFTRLREEHRLARLILDAIERHLTARGPVRMGAELADLLHGLDDHVDYEDRILFPYLRDQLPGRAEALDHAREEHAALAEQLALLSAALRAGRPYEGRALKDVRHHFQEEEDQIVSPALAASLTRTPIGGVSRLLAQAAEIEALASRLPELGPEPQSAGEPTRWGGQRGARLDPARVERGQRVVTERGEHGRVVDASAIVVSSGFGTRRDEDVHYSFTLELDSGRKAIPWGNVLYEELAPPTAVVKDVLVGQVWLAPAEVWSRAYSRYQDAQTYTDRAASARKPEKRAEWVRARQKARQEAAELIRLLAHWRWNHEGEPIEGLREQLYRRMDLDLASTRAAHEDAELDLLKRLPSDWDTRFQAGDSVQFYMPREDGEGRTWEVGWTIEELRGHRAVVSHPELPKRPRPEIAPLWLLKPDDQAPLVETFTQPRYLREIAEEMLSRTEPGRPYPNRGAVARAVKSFLAEHGLAVSTRVGQGSMVTSIDLSPPSGRWEPDERDRMMRLLPGINVYNDRQASFEPWETTGDKDTYQGDYSGKSAGILVPAEHVARMAVLLASAMKADGQQLNVLGERRLAAAQAQTSATRPAPAGNRGGASSEQRAEAAEGCIDVVFDLPGFGRVEVKCGQLGRRDTWHNVWIANERYGFNGGRWARGQKPPPAVLEAIEERGIRAFGR